MKPLICIDFDDVLTETARALALLSGQLFGTRVAYQEIGCFDLGVAFGLDASQLETLMERAHEASFLEALEPVPGAIEALRDLSGKADIEIVTGRPPICHEASRKWLARFDLDLPVLHIDKYGRFPKGTPESLSVEAFAARPYRVAVDDSPIALKQLAARRNCSVFVFDRPWNLACELPSCRRAANWSELHPLVLELL